MDVLASLPKQFQVHSNWAEKHIQLTYFTSLKASMSLVFLLNLYRILTSFSILKPESVSTVSAKSQVLHIIRQTFSLFQL